MSSRFNFLVLGFMLTLPLVGAEGRTEEPALVRPKRITLKVSNASLAKVVEELAKLTGFKIFLEPGDSDPVAKKAYSFQFEKTDFWVALDHICKEANLAINLEYSCPAGERYLKLKPSDAITPYVLRRQAFRLAANGCKYWKTTQVSRGINFDGSESPRRGAKAEETQTSEGFHIDLSLLAEPGLEIYDVREIRVDVAVDDQGHSLVPKNTDDQFEFRDRPHQFMPRVNEQSTDRDLHKLRLRPPGMSVRSLKVVRGSMSVLVENENKVIVVTEDLKKACGKKFDLDNLQIEVESFGREPKAVGTFLLAVKAKQKHEGERSPPCHYEFVLQDAKGNWFQAEGLGGSLGDTECDLQISYPDNPTRPARAGKGPAPFGEPSKLICIQSTPLVYHLPFEFRDLPVK